MKIILVVWDENSIFDVPGKYCFYIAIYLLRNCGPINPISVRLEAYTEDTASGAYKRFLRHLI